MCKFMIFPFYIQVFTDFYFGTKLKSLFTIFQNFSAEYFTNNLFQCSRALFIRVLIILLEITGFS